MGRYQARRTSLSISISISISIISVDSRVVALLKTDTSPLRIHQNGGVMYP